MFHLQGGVIELVSHSQYVETTTHPAHSCEHRQLHS